MHVCTDVDASAVLCPTMWGMHVMENSLFTSGSHLVCIFVVNVTKIAERPRDHKLEQVTDETRPTKT